MCIDRGQGFVFQTDVYLYCNAQVSRKGCFDRTSMHKNCDNDRGMCDVEHSFESSSKSNITLKGW